MPAVSEAQRRAMYAAAEGKSTLGIPSSVGKEYIKADSSDKIKSAGIAYITHDNKVLLIKRGVDQDHPSEWAFPGGHLDDDETPEHAAIREFTEEVGGRVTEVIAIGKFEHFASYKATGGVFDVKLSDESQDYGFFALDDLPQPMHPRALAILHSELFKRAGLNELQIAKEMASGTLNSPQKYANTTLFKLRITGTGVAYRSAFEEFTWRSPSDYLTPEFVERCNGLPVILEHSEHLLDGKELSKRIVGTILYPYIEAPDVMGIAKIYNEDAAELMTNEQLSTSPSVMTGKDAKLVMADGSTCNVEGSPIVLDHLAICAVGVWDKGGAPVGVIKNDSEDIKMTEDIKPDASEPLKALHDSLERLHSRMDSFDKTLNKLKKKAKGNKAKADEGNMPTELLDAKKDGIEEGKREEGKEIKADSGGLHSDSDLRAEIEKMRASLPKALSDADLNTLSETQTKADSVFSHFGEKAPRYMQGETPEQFRRRILDKLKPNSSKWGKIDLAAVDHTILEIAESEIYADSVKAASTMMFSSDGGLHPIIKKTPAGHTVTEWRGDQFKGSGGFWMNPSVVNIIPDANKNSPFFGGN